MKTYIFKHPDIHSAQDAMRDSEFWLWLESRGNGRFRDDAKQFLSARGYVIGKHKLAREDFDVLKATHNHFYYINHVRDWTGVA